MFKRILDDNPDLYDDREAAVEAFVEACERESNSLEREEALRYAGVNAFRALAPIVPRKIKPYSAVERSKMNSILATREMMRRVFPTGVLTMMPNGKKLLDCTGKELFEMGGILTFLGSSIEPDEVLGEKIKQDDELLQLLSVYNQ